MKSVWENLYTRVLQIHKRTHTREKSYECNQCGKAFVYHNLLRYKITYTGEKAYEYNQCEKAISQHTGLQIHIIVHTGEKPYECNQCGKAFSQESSNFIKEPILERILMNIINVVKYMHIM